MNIAVLGTGYVGLVTGACFSERGNNVVCVDVDQDKIAKLNRSEIPIYEPGLKELVTTNIAAKRLTFTTNLNDGLQGCEVIFLALPTPPEEDGSADLSYILGMAKTLAPLLKKYTVIVDKSTVPVGTADRVTKIIAENTDIDFDVVSNPEFLKEGFAVDDFMNPDRVVIGAETEKARTAMELLYEPFIADQNQLIHMDIRSAEMTKYAANSFLATKISFMNEIANICEKVGADIDNVRRGIGTDTRIGHKFLYSGIGYGGSCFPKDVKALQKIANEHDYETEILRAVETVNEKQKTVIVKKLKKYYPDLAEKTIALWGLAFKPDTDDIREAPALQIIDELLDEGALVVAHDPEAIDNVKSRLGSSSKVIFTDDMYAALSGADALIIATEWHHFIDADLKRVKQLLKEPLILDGRNIYKLEHVIESGITYESIGREVIRG